MRKPVFLLSLMIITALMFYFGINHWNNNIAANAKKTKEYSLELKAQEKREIEAAKQTWLGKTDPSVVLLGSSVTAGTGASNSNKSWAGLLRTYFLTTNKDLKFINLAVGGYKTEDIIKKGTLDQAISLKPDVLILETCLLNDFNNTSLNDLESNISTIVKSIKKNSPSTRVVILPPDQPGDIAKRVDTQGITFREYEQKSGEFIKSNGWEYVSYWDSFEQLMNENDVQLRDLLSDGIHPNDKGYELWFNAIKPYFTKN